MKSVSSKSDAPGNATLAVAKSMKIELILMNFKIKLRALEVQFMDSIDFSL
jgi:hypothetical protein